MSGQLNAAVYQRVYQLMRLAASVHSAALHADDPTYARQLHDIKTDSSTTELDSALCNVTQYYHGRLFVYVLDVLDEHGDDGIATLLPPQPQRQLTQQCIGARVAFDALRQHCGLPRVRKVLKKEKTKRKKKKKERTTGNPRGGHGPQAGNILGPPGTEETMQTSACSSAAPTASAGTVGSLSMIPAQLVALAADSVSQSSVEENDVNGQFQDVRRRGRRRRRRRKQHQPPRPHVQRNTHVLPDNPFQVLD